MSQIDCQGELVDLLSESFCDEPIHEDNEIQECNGQQTDKIQQQQQWTTELHDAELYVFFKMECCEQQNEDDLMIAPSKAAIILEFSCSSNSIILRVDSGLYWQIGESSSVSKETKFDYNIIIPPDQHLLLILHKDTPPRIITEIDQQLKQTQCNFDDSRAQIRGEWELVGDYEPPNAEDLIAQIIGHGGLRVANGITTGSNTLIKTIERVGMFSRHMTWKSGEEEELPPKVVEGVENALWVSEKGNDIITGVADTVTGITTYVGNGVGNSLRATGWFTTPKDAPQWRSVKVAKTIGAAWMYSSGKVWDSFGKGVEGVVTTSCKETTLFLRYKYGLRAGQVAENVCGTFYNCYNASKTLRKLCFKTVATDALQQTAYDLYPQDVPKQ